MAKAFVDALGQRNAVMMQHHGIMVCGRNVQEAVVVTKEVEISAGVQLKAMAAGALRLLPHAEAIRAREHKKTERSYIGVWNYEVGKINQSTPNLFN
jgi:L-fuculose-phosphate aldolase